ncbi:MAG: DMT family transporter [bacterium]
MNWFLIALVAPFVWGIVNIGDHYLISKYSDTTKERSSGGLVLFPSMIAVFVVFFIMIFNNGIFNISLNDKILLMLSGALTIIWMVLYLYALEIEDTSAIVPWFLTVPVFGFVLGYFFLGETLNIKQLIGSIVVLIGVALVSFNFFDKEKKTKRKPVFYMLIACFILAVSGVIFKFVTVEGNFWVSSFWEYFGLGSTGFLIFLFIPKFRKEFMHMNRTGGRKIFFVNIVTEFLTIMANLVTNFALLLAPVAMVYLVGSFQPAIVLFLTIIGTKFLPHIIKEDISKKTLVPKIIAVVLMTIGSIILFL